MAVFLFMEIYILFIYCFSDGNTSVNGCYSTEQLANNAANDAKEINMYINTEIQKIILDKPIASIN